MDVDAGVLTYYKIIQKAVLPIAVTVAWRGSARD
jgi:hypothetical protein